jgi:double-stranded uracil-DNA glycosylase
VPARSAAAGRPSPRELAEAVERGAAVRDVIEPGLDVLFCGINPGRWSGAVGHHFAHPGNRFWKALYLAGFTDRQLDPADERLLLLYRIGITNLVDRTTAAAADVGAEELREGALSLERKVRRLHPRTVAFLGMGAFRVAFGRPRIAAGRQPEPLAGADVWVLPNPSGLQAAYGLEQVVDQLRSLRDFISAAER